MEQNSEDSIKKAVDNPPQNKQNNSQRPPRREEKSKPNVWEPKKQTPPSEMSFEDMMSKFKQNSEEKMCDLKRSTDRKNGTRRK